MSDEWDEILQQSPVEETFDWSWPYTFKWAFDSQTGRAEVWRTRGGTDGRPVHRREVEDRWGRPPRVQDGDVMGLASYIPAEMKIDGTIVAPPEIHTQTYYNQPTPQEITQWFQREFPHATVRDAVIVAPRLGKVAAPRPIRETLKWIWNDKNGLLIWTADEENRPFHNEKALAEWNRQTSPFSEGDQLGYAYPGPENVEVETYNGSPIDPSATGALRKQLAEWFPNHQIVFDHVGLIENGDLDFHSDPADYRTATLAWAHANLGPEDLHRNPQISDVRLSNGSERRWRGLTRLFRKKTAWEKTAEADMEGCMVALFLSEETAKKLRPRGGEDFENMHITLLYFKDKAGDRDDWDEVKKLVEQVANQHPTLHGKISGYGVFNSPDGDVLWASPSVQGLAELRHKLYQACTDAGFTINDEHDWVPHVTLKYDHKGKLPKPDEETSLYFTDLSFAQGEKKRHYEFKGHLEKTTMAADPEWVQNWIAENGPYLYHGSGGRDQFGNPMQILQQGIVPGRVDNNPNTPRAEDYGWDGTDPYDYPSDYDADMDEWWHKPRPGHTYLVTNPEDAYGTHLFRVDVRGLDPANFNADDDYLREYGNTIGPLLAPGQEYTDVPGSPFKDWDEVRKNLKTLGEQAEEQDWGSNPEDTHNSWKNHPVHHGGAVAYRGTIPPHLIEHAALRPSHGGPWQYNEGFSSPVDPKNYQPKTMEDWTCEKCGRPGSEHEPTYDQQTGIIVSVCPGQRRAQHEGHLEKRAMAERSGVPEIDKLIEDFLKEPYDEYGDTGETFRDPEQAHGNCQAVTEKFVEFAKARGFNAYATDTDLDEMGYKPSVEPFGEVGFDENDEMQYGFYPEHTVASIYLEGQSWPIIIDFTATQYGYTDHPKVSSTNDYLDWSGWEGAHRFVTDGKEILTDPETEPIDKSQWRDTELEDKFRTIYPEAKSLVSGWTVPTADGMGLGIYAPAAGHGDKHEPGLHEIIAIVEKEFSKPSHLITNSELLSDEKAYQPMKSTAWQTLSHKQTKPN